MDDLKMALTACMEEYDREIRQAVSQLRPGDGFMGLGRDPRREPCHLRFYESAGELVARAVREGLAPEAAAETARFLLTLSQAEGYHELTDPMREAAQGHVLTLTALLPPETAAEFNFSDYDYVVDAVDTVTAKVTLVLEAQKAGVPIISCMGAGNKLDPSRFRVADIYKTQGCPLARVMRTALRKRGVKKLKVVYSDEIPTRPIEDMSINCRSHCICPPGAKHKCTERRDIPGSTAFVPSVAGLIIAGEVVKDLSRA